MLYSLPFLQCSYHSDEEGSPSRPESRSQYSLASLSSYDSVGHPLQFVDDGEAVWDSLGRMGLLRRSSRFDKSRLVTVVLHRGKGGFGLELEGQMPSTVSQVCKYSNYLVITDVTQVCMKEAGVQTALVCVCSAFRCSDFTIHS